MFCKSFPVHTALFEICAHFRMRWKQGCRMAVQLGIFRLLLVAVAFFYLCVVIYMVSAGKTNRYYVAAAWMLILLSVQLKRGDRKFLYLHTSYDRLICAAGNMALSVPILVCLLLHGGWRYAVLIAVTAFLTGFIPMRYRKRRQNVENTWLPRKIPYDAYEWRGGVRQSSFWLASVGAIGLFGACFSVVGYLSIFLTGLIVFDFYRHPEPWPFILSLRKSAGRFLLFKIRRNLLFFVLLTLPVAVLLVVFHPVRWYVPLLEVVLLSGVHLYGIVLKYVYYSHRKAPVRSLSRIMGLIIGLNPFTAPLLWAFTAYLFIKARTNLTFYLHDYNR